MHLVQNPTETCDFRSLVFRISKEKGAFVLLKFDINMHYFDKIQCASTNLISFDMLKSQTNQMKLSSLNVEQHEIHSLNLYKKFKGN